MTNKFSFGAPVFTGAVVEKLSLCKSKFPVGKIESEWPFTWNYNLEKTDIVFGLGESVRGMNKRGFKYVSWCLDCPNQSENTPSMYGAHNFLLVFGKNPFGIFFDTASRIEFDIGWTDQDVMTVKTEDTGVEVYVIFPSQSAKDNVLTDITRQFRALIGQSYIPPRWAFGYQQSRWGYKTEADVREVVRKYRELNIPLDSVVLDIDYMTEYMDFTVDKEKFSDLKGLSAELKKDGMHLIPIIDAGVKVKEGYDVYEEGVKNGYFATKEDGTPYAAGVWPGRSHFTDFFNPQAREWFGSKYKILTDQGIEGFWNDMNEPAMFYSDDSLKEAFDKLESYKGKNLDIQTFFEFTPISGSTFNQLEDYKRFYHRVPGSSNPDEKIRHDKIHNLYGAWMTRAAGEGLEKISPDKRMLIYSRASAIGAHRYGGIWTGDNASTWSHLLQEIKMLPGVNMCGFLYSGADIGGFGDSTSRDLLMRWLALGDFTPLMRNHSAWNTRLQECYSFKNPEEFKSIIDLRYALLPYIYSEFVKAAVNGDSYIRPLAFDYPNDRRAVCTEDELMVGSDILLAPVYTQNAEGRYVYLPEDMTMVTWSDSRAEQKPMSAGDHFVEIPLETVVFFVKKGRAVPLFKSALSSEQIDMNSAYLVGDAKSCELYTDDGYSRKINLNEGMREIK